MASTLFFCQDYGIATGLMPRGSGRVTGQSNWNWKNIDDPNAVYSDYPITAGNNSFSNYNFVVWSGSFNMITGAVYQHTGTGMGIGLSVFGFLSGSGTYVAPATTATTLFTVDFTPTGGTAQTSGLRVGGLGPELSGKGLSSTSNPVFSEYIGHQLRTLASAQPGDTTGTYFHYFSWTEN